MSSLAAQSPHNFSNLSQPLASQGASLEVSPHRARCLFPHESHCKSATAQHSCVHGKTGHIVRGQIIIEALQLPLVLGLDAGSRVVIISCVCESAVKERFHTSAHCFFQRRTCHRSSVQHENQTLNRFSVCFALVILSFL